MALAGDDPRGDIQNMLAPEESGQRCAGIDGAAMEIAVAVREPPQALGERCRAQLQLDPGADLVELADGGGQDCVHPHRICRDPEAAGTT